MNNEMIALQKKEFKDLLNYPMIGATAAKLARTSSIRAFGDSLFSKKPRINTDPGIIGWHIRSGLLAYLYFSQHAYRLDTTPRLYRRHGPRSLHQRKPQVEGR